MRTISQKFSAFLLVALCLLEQKYAAAAEVVAAGGNVRFGTTPLCALVLINGQTQFSCDGTGRYDMQVPVDDNGMITVMSFADGFAPFSQIVTPAQAAEYPVAMLLDQNSPSLQVDKTYGPSATEGRFVVSGTINFGAIPVCALVLANGQNMFSCNENLGQFSLDVPIDQDGNITLMIFADGFKPYKDIISTTAPSAYSATKLVGDTAATGPLQTDPNLVNPWGITFGPTTPAWAANNHSDTSTLYDGNGNVIPLVVNLPDEFEATGMVFNNTSDFGLSTGDNAIATNFIFAGESGKLAGWAQAVDLTNAVTVFTADDEAMYFGLAIANNGSGNFLYAADFRNGKIDVFDAAFTRQSGFAFTDPNLPAGYAPFGIQALKTGAAGETQIYVSYAQQDSGFEEVPGAGLGLVVLYDTNGNFIKQLVPTGGQLNAPWGIALAPADFGTLSGALLVGNFGDGRINGYDVTTGAYRGTIADSTGTAFAVPGLWGIAFGNDAVNQPHDTLFYTAGTNNEVNGEYGRIDLGASPPLLGAPPVVTVTAPSGGTVSGAVTVTASVTDSIAIARVEVFANGISLGVVTTAPYSVLWDTTTVTNGSVALTAIARDVNRNVATSAPVSVVVLNTAATTTLTQLQTSIFTPHCSTCHTGNPSIYGNGLPGIMNLTAGNSFAALVGVTSLEQSGLKRVAPGDAANSYIIRKLEGAPGITGVRMPSGGPFLDQATIDQVKSWINAGALNN